MKQHNWLGEILEDVASYCGKNNLLCTKSVLKAAFEILEREKVEVMETDSNVVSIDQFRQNRERLTSSPKLPSL